MSKFSRARYKYEIRFRKNSFVILENEGIEKYFQPQFAATATVTGVSGFETTGLWGMCELRIWSLPRAVRHIRKHRRDRNV